MGISIIDLIFCRRQRCVLPLGLHLHVLDLGLLLVPRVDHHHALFRLLPRDLLHLRLPLLALLVNNIVLNILKLSVLLSDFDEKSFVVEDVAIDVFGRRQSSSVESLTWLCIGVIDWRPLKELLRWKMVLSVTLEGGRAPLSRA